MGSYFDHFDDSPPRHHLALPPDTDPWLTWKGTWLVGNPPPFQSTVKANIGNDMVVYDVSFTSTSQFSCSTNFRSVGSYVGFCTGSRTETGLALKAVDANNHYAVLYYNAPPYTHATTRRVLFDRFVGAVRTNLASVNIPGLSTLRVDIDGNTFHVYADGVFLFSVTDAVISGTYYGLRSFHNNCRASYYDWWELSWRGGEDNPVYLTTDDSGEIYPTVTNDVSGIAGVSEDNDGVIHIEAPRVATDLGDGVLLVE